MRLLAAFGAAAVLVGVALGSASAQDFPSRPITLVIPAAAGGTTDLSGRVVAKGLSERLGQPVIIENKTGAGGIIAAEYVTNAKPDGYTLLMGSNGILAGNVSLYKKLPYDPMKFTLIFGDSVAPLLLVVPAGSPFKSFAELVSYAKQNPKKLTYASNGVGTASHLLPELMANQTGISLLHVPYRASAQVQTELQAGRIDLAFDYSIIVKPQIAAGKLRALAQTGPTRLPSHQDVPTFVELGYPRVQFMGWAALVGPPGMPQPIVDKIATAFNATMKDPAINKYHQDMGITLLTDFDAQKVREMMVKETANFKDWIELAGVTPE